MGKKWDRLVARIEALEKALGLGGKKPKAAKPKNKKKKAAKPAAKPKKKAKRTKKALPPVPAIIPGL